MVPEMLNLLGCNKNDFKELLKAMNYKIIERNDDIFFKYNPKKNIKKTKSKTTKESPFKILKDLNLN